MQIDILISFLKILFHAFLLSALIIQMLNKYSLLIDESSTPLPTPLQI